MKSACRKQGPGDNKDVEHKAAKAATLCYRQPSTHLLTEPRRLCLNILLWVLQIVAALLYASSGVMKVFLFGKVSKDVPSFGALPRSVWTALGILELLGTIALILPGILHSHTNLTVDAAIVLCFESLLFIWVHVKYTEKTPIIMSAVLGIIMAFIAYGRFALTPL